MEKVVYDMIKVFNDFIDDNKGCEDWKIEQVFKSFDGVSVKLVFETFDEEIGETISFNNGKEILDYIYNKLSHCDL